MPDRIPALTDEPSRAAAPAPAAPVRERAILTLQRQVGNRATGRILARWWPFPTDLFGATAPAQSFGQMLPASQPATPTPTPAPAAAAPSATADWLTIVPDADADAIVKSTLAGTTQTLVHSKRAPKKGETAPAPAAAPGAAEQAKIDAACQAVADYRATLKQPAATGAITKSQGASWAGTWWTRHTDRKFKPPTPTKKVPEPADTRTEAQRAAYDSAVGYDTWLKGVSAGTTAVARPATATAPEMADYKKWLIKRLFIDIAGLEGGTDSINVYDKQIITWGGGLGGASGAVPAAMKRVADSTVAGGQKVVGTEVTRVLRSAGISFGTKADGTTEFVVLDPASKRKYRGDNGLHIIKADNRLLMLFTSISRGELPGQESEADLKTATRQAVFDAQQEYFRGGYANGAFGKAIEQLAATWPYDSLMMVLHLQWWGVSNWKQYVDTAGDMKAIIKKAHSLYGSYTTTRNGANVALRDLAHHLYDFGGASSKACWGPLTELADDALEAGKYYAEMVPARAAVAAVAEVKDAAGKVTTKAKAGVDAKNPQYRKLID